MHNQHQINVKSITDIPLCQQTLTDYLAFHQVNVTALNPLFKGSICVDTFTSLPFIQAVKLDMFTHTTHFIHADCASHCQQHCVLIHSLSSLIVNAQKKDIHLPAGSYMLIPAWEPFTLKSLSHHYGLIFNLDIHETGLKRQSLSELFWKVGNHLRYGNMVNNLLCDYYAPLSDTCYKQLLNGIKTLLTLQSEQVACPCNFNKTNFIPNFDICAIAHLIRQNMANPHYSINELANHYGMTIRMLQYKLARYQLSFSELLASARCELLAMTIRNMPDTDLDVLVKSCGFANLRMANRQFKKLRNQTLMQFQAQEQGHFHNTQLNPLERAE
ncbi:helix-turn-helix domain-containing protein [Proteus terrae]|uniref:helix-turn-helix domain-containing protein n=1 Tax=Proteus terrae TaxID=1574161 RepID=UPI001F32B7D2|nr:helix-turn-helix domain-containing protein [Proteus terrae]